MLIDMTDSGRQPDRRSERSRQVILDTTRKLLIENPDVGSLTVEAVAARSGIAKTTIYRQWRDKWQLALDAVMIDILPTRYADPVDVGDTRKELLTFVNSVVESLGGRPFGPAMQGLVSEIATNPELGLAYRQDVIEPRRRQLAAVIERGIERGDLRPDTSVEILHEFLLGPIFYRLLLSSGSLDRKLGDRLVDQILKGFAPRP